MFTYPIDKLRLSHSSLTTLESCYRKWEFYKLLRLYSKGDNFHGDTGNALHRGWQTFVLTEDKELAALSMMLAYPIHLNTDPRDYKSLEACLATLDAMIDHPILAGQQIAQILCKDGVTRPAIEVPFRINFPNFNIRLNNGKEIEVEYVGFIDVILYSILENVFSVMDIKSHRDNAKDLGSKFIYDQQPLPYGLVLQQAVSSELTSFAVQFLSCYVDIAEPKITPYRFTKTIDDVNDWVKSLVITLNNLKWMIEKQWFKRVASGSHCRTYNRVCPAIDLCGSRDTEALFEYIQQTQADDPWKETPIDPWIELDIDMAAVAEGKML
jgi:hypothetical protein